jgi:hypothetical protein
MKREGNGRPNKIGLFNIIRNFSFSSVREGAKKGGAAGS